MPLGLRLSLWLLLLLGLGGWCLLDLLGMLLRCSLRLQW